MIEGKTKSGYAFKYDERILNDYSLLEAIGRFDRAETKIEQVAALNDMLDYMLGDNKESLMEHIAAMNDGFRPVDKIQEELIEIVSMSKDLKNS